MSLSSSNPQPAAVKVTRSVVLSNRVTKKVARMAGAIVDLVERTDGPVLLHEIDQEVPGVKPTGAPGYTYFIEYEGKEALYWEGMTKAGLEALRHVLNDRRVAVQYVSRFPYFFDGVEVDDENWQPVALLPVRAANIDTPKWAMRISPKAREMMLVMGGAKYRPLTPEPVRFTADQFCSL
jgi:hypothetical protein